MELAGGGGAGRRGWSWEEGVELGGRGGAGKRGWGYEEGVGWGIAQVWRMQFSKPNVIFSP